MPRGQRERNREIKIERVVESSSEYKNRLIDALHSNWRKERQKKNVKPIC